MTDEPGRVELVQFGLEDRRYGVETEYVREIADDEGTRTRVPGAPDPVEGVLEVRGEVAVAVDARRLLGEERVVPERGLPPGVGGEYLARTGEGLTADQLIVLDRGSDRPIALVVDAVEGVGVVDVDAAGRPADPDPPHLKAVLEDDGAEIRVLDPEGIARAVD